VTTTRRFEFEDDTSSKFWEIAVEGTSHTVRFGRIGSPGQTKTKAFASTREATLDAETLVSAKLRKGYREVATPAPARPPSPAPNSEPGVRTTLKPPRGRKPIVLTLTGAVLDVDGVRESFESAALAKRALDKVVRARTSEGFTLGSVDILEVAPVVVESEEPFEEAPAVLEPEIERDEHGRLRISFEADDEPTGVSCASAIARIHEEKARVVHVLGDIGLPGTAWAEAVAGQSMPSLTGFIFDVYFQTQGQQRDYSIGDLRATFAALPSVERFFATGDHEIAKKGTHSKLRELYLLGDPLTSEFLQALATWKFPALERFVVSITAEAFPGDGSDDAILRALRFDAPRLRAVCIEAVHDAVHVLERLIASKAAQSWTDVRIAGNVDEDALIAAVERHAAKLRKLEVLALPLSEVSTGAGEALRRLCPSIVDFGELSRLTLPSAYETWTDAESR
jgi:predicted DNA-binding WGR domain protein